MALIKTTQIEQIILNYGNEGDPPSIEYRIGTKIDDPDDDDLPIVKHKMSRLFKSVTTMHTDPETMETTTTDVETDISEEPQIIQDIAAVVWV